jgi:hypothetical protein
MNIVQKQPSSKVIIPPAKVHKPPYIPGKGWEMMEKENALYAVKQSQLPTRLKRTIYRGFGAVGEFVAKQWDRYQTFRRENKEGQSWGSGES